ncbi:MAG: transmembrane anchor protein [Oceanospirillaceae bacterium]
MQTTTKDNIQTASSKQLLVSTFTAASVAAILLVTIVLPAEFALDATGVGRFLGLQEMGEIKQSLAQDAENSELAENDDSINQQPFIKASDLNDLPTTQKVPKLSPPKAIAELSKSVISAKVTTPIINTIKQSYQIKPNDSLELKFEMKKGTSVDYQWYTKGGPLNFDNHADKPGVSYHNYSKGRKVTTDEGKITAAFDGNHGWFWRNRAGKTVTIVLTFSGDYISIKPVVRN